MSMTKIAVGVLAALVVGVLALAALAYAGVATIPGIETNAGSDHNVGRHAYKVNIIGRPNNWNGDDTGSNGKVLFIGLKTNAQEVTCELGSGVGDDTGQTTDQVPAGHQTIYFTGTTDGTFDILDRDATDGSARIAIPANVAGYDIYIRVLGKPGGCLDANAFAVNSTGTFFFAGHLDANRRSGTPEKIRVDALFFVHVDTNGDGIPDTVVSVFDASFKEYFWQIANNGLRNMQLIFVAAT